uniref:F-box/WD repeat-containing protein 9 n=1 Tax=Lygus hesperus TaxID=30085 RepID=A0A146LBH8_LYGHE
MSDPVGVTPEITDSTTDRLCLSLIDLPTEVILKIFDYLSPVFLHRVISRVCRKFNGILFCEFLWKRAYHTNNSLIPTTSYPFLQQIGLYSSKWKTGRDISWRHLCVSTENAKSRWFDEEKTISFPFGETTVNVVHVMKGGYCLTGSRERSIKVWDLMQKKESHYVHNAHNGWLSGLCTIGDSIVSSGWDSYVKVWSLRDNMEPLNAFCLDMAVMAVDSQPNMIVACTFPELVIIDPRIGRPDGFSRFVMEEGSVVQLAFWQNSVVLASRSKALMQFDLRMGRTCVRESIQTESPPRTMSVLNDIVYVGDNAGNVYLYDLYDRFKMVEMFEMCETKAQIRALVPRNGYMIVGSSDGELKAVLSVKGPNGLKVLKSHYCGGEVSCGHYNDETLAILNGTIGVVTIFLP